ncbi:hypothetical protein V5N11_000409 [Cardamine amara subsp. amara]|uniref:Uncharacterized protein n=1 Tax=Cardamine amara subsp. amara TaxID=228776 RepID=A0ABD0Z4C6_CARAN
MDITFAVASTKTSQGYIEDLHVRVGDCPLPSDFQIIEMSNGSSMPLILGRPFLATAGAFVDLPNKRIAFSHIDENVFYDATPEYANVSHDPCVAIDGGKKAVPRPPITLSNRNRVNEVLERDIHVYAKKSPRVCEKEQPKSEVLSLNSHVTLTTLRHVGDTIEYKLRYKGKAKPFSKIRAIITPEFKEKGQTVVDDMLAKVLEI